MRRRVHNVLRSFSARMVLISLSFLTIIALLTTLLVTSQYQHTVQSQNKESALIAFSSVKSQIDALLSNAKSSALLIAQSSAAKAYLTGNYQSDLEMVMLLQDMNKSINNAFIHSEHIAGMLFFRADGQAAGIIGSWVFSWGNVNSRILGLAKQAGQVPAYTMHWAGACNGVDFIPIPHTDGVKKTFNLPMIYGLGQIPLTYTGSGDPLYMLAGVHEESVRQCFSHLANAGETMYLLGEAGEVLSCGDPGLIGSVPGFWPDIDDGRAFDDKIVKLDRVEYQLIYYRLGGPDWMLVKQIPLYLYAHQTYTLIIRSLSISLAVLLLVCAGYAVWAHSFTRPFREISARLYDIQQNHLNARMLIHSNIYEFNLIEKQFNDMVDSIEELRRKDVESQQEKLLLELRNLQSQINPHFIYNSIASIRWLATFTGQNMVSDMLIELAESLKPVFTEWSTVWSIDDELTFLGHYMKLMKLRYNVFFEIVNELPEALMSAMIPRFIVQPMLENACEHGTAPGRRLSIKLHLVRAGSDMEFSVIDDGRGIPPEMLHKLNRALAQKDPTLIRTHSKHGIGLHNVHRRLELFYGEGYGLTIQSVIDEGTTMTIRLKT